MNKGDLAYLAGRRAGARRLRELARKNQPQRHRGTEIFWKDATRELPDDDMTVLLALNDGEVWTGFREAGVWRFVSADPVDQDGQTRVTHWADFPAPPSVSQSLCGKKTSTNTPT